MSEPSDREPPLFSEGDTVVDATAPAVFDAPETQLDGPSDGPAHFDEGPTVVGRSEAEIESLVQQGLVIVAPLARKVAQHVRRLSDVDELASVGRTALFDAARSHDATLSPFLPYATNKMRWAMIDSVRRVRGRSEAARATALAALQRVAEAPSDAASDKLDSEEAYRAALKKRLAADAAALFVGLVSTPVEASTEPDESPDVLLMRRRAANALRDAMGRLPERHREIVERHYFGGERFDHIAESMGVSKSWLSRLHAQAIELLGEALREH